MEAPKCPRCKARHWSGQPCEYSAERVKPLDKLAVAAPHMLVVDQVAFEQAERIEPVKTQPVVKNAAPLGKGLVETIQERQADADRYMLAMLDKAATPSPPPQKIGEGKMGSVAERVCPVCEARRERDAARAKRYRESRK